MKEQIRTAHFWLLLVGVSVGGAMEIGLIPDTGVAHRLAVLSMIVLNALGVHMAAKWIPSNSIRPKLKTVPPAAILPLLALSALSGCAYCLDQAHKNEARCQAQDVATKCGVPAVQKVVQQILPQVVLALINDSWSSLLDNLVNTLEQQGVQDALTAVTCAVSSTDININSVLGGARAASLNPSLIQTVHEHATAWMGLHRARASR